MKRRSRTEQAEALFAKGFSATSKEVKALGFPYISRKTLHNKWKKKAGIVTAEEPIPDKIESPQASIGESPQTPQQANLPPPPDSPKVTPEFPSIETLEDADDGLNGGGEKLLKDLIDAAVIGKIEGTGKIKGSDFVIYQAMQATEHAWGWPKMEKEKWLQVFIREMCQKHGILLPAFVDMRELQKSKAQDN